MPVTTPLKRCTKCGAELPATTDYFYPHPTAANGLHPQCKACQRAARKQYYAANREAVLAHQKQYDALHLEEKRARDEQWRRRNKAYISEKNRQYREQHRDSLNAYTREYHDAHKDRLNAMSRRYYRATLPIRLAQAREYRLSHSEQRARWQRDYYRKNASRLSVFARVRAMWKRAGDGVTAEDVERQYLRQEGFCYWCSCVLQEFHVDHVIPLSRGGSHDPGNIVVACPSCNQSKHAKLPYSEWQPPAPLDSIDR